MDFETNTAASNAAPPPQSPVQADAQPPVETAVVMGSPSADVKPTMVSVYADSITANSYCPDSPVVSFDVVFSVIIADGDKSTSYKLVKRIGVDRAQLAIEALGTVPVTVIEDKAEEITKAAKLNEHLAQMRQIAGVPAKK